MQLRIARVDAFPVVYPTAGRFKFLEGPAGQPLGRPSVLVRVLADNGQIGWGQSVPVPTWSYETLETVQTTIVRHLAPRLLGLDPLDFEAVHDVMNRAITGSFSVGQPICKAGIDLALHDLAGRLAGKNLRDLWGRHGQDDLLLSWTVNPVALDDAEAMVQQGWERGYRHFNVKVGGPEDFDVELCARVRRLAPEGFLWADANGGYTEAAALSVAPKLAALGVAVLEQPLPPNRLSGYKRLRQQGALPIIMDEGIVSCVELAEFIKLDLLDGVAIKPARCAGLTEARKQVEMVLNEGLMFLGSGLTDPDWALSAAAQLYAAYDLKYPAALNGPQFLAESLLQQPIPVADGRLKVPTGPGLGVEGDQARIDRCAVDRSD